MSILDATYQMSDAYGSICGEQMAINYNNKIYYCSDNAGWSDEDGVSIDERDIPQELIELAFKLHRDWWAEKCDEYMNLL